MKLNNKGITTVEVLICFILVAVITMSLYSVISSFNEKRLEESNKTKILIYKNTLTKKIQDDIVKKGLTYATTTEEVKEDDGKVVTLKMTFKDGTTSVLKVTQLFTKSSLHVDGIKEKDDKFSVYYGKEGDLEEYPLPDLGEYRSYYKEMSDADDCDHSTGICIESCDNDNEDCIKAGIAKELQINNIQIITNESDKQIHNERVLSIYIGFYHPELENKYAINIVAPINYPTTYTGSNKNLFN